MDSRRKRVFVACVVLFSGLMIMPANAKKPPEEWDGLTKTKVKGVDLAYVKQGADISVYDKIMLDPVEVTFDKNWDPERAGTHFRINQGDRDAISKRIAELTEKTFSQEITKDGGYPVVSEPGPDVMRITAAITDVYIAAPDTDEPGRVTTFTTSSGHATLVAEFRDSETGALFARVVDEREARNSGEMRWTNRVENAHEAQMVISDWTRILRKQLDAVHSTGQPSAVAEKKP